MALDELSCVIFAAFTGEEIGMFGASRFVELLEEHAVEPKAMLNLDMIGRLADDSVAIVSAASAPEWQGMLAPQCQGFGLTCNLDNVGLGASDNVAFLSAQIPAIHFFTGVHTDYHRKSDTPDRVNYPGAVKVARMVTSVLLSVLDPQQPITFDPGSLAATAGGGGDLPGGKPYLGTIPDFTGVSNPNIKGVLLSGVSPGGPADKAGVQGGDYLLAIDDKATETLMEFSFVLRTLKPNQTVMLKLRRGSKNIVLPAVVGCRAP